MKLAHKAADSASVCFRPSRYESTSPNTIPKGSPFKNSITGLTGSGTKAKPARAASAARINPTIAVPRYSLRISETMRIPMNFESMYPASCEITRTVFSPSPKTSSP